MLIVTPARDINCPFRITVFEDSNWQESDNIDFLYIFLLRTKLCYIILLWSNQNNMTSYNCANTIVYTSINFNISTIYSFCLSCVLLLLRIVLEPSQQSRYLSGAVTVSQRHNSNITPRLIFHNSYDERICHAARGYE
jgi:hypothetical protein